MTLYYSGDGKGGIKSEKMPIYDAAMLYQASMRPPPPMSDRKSVV